MTGTISLEQAVERQIQIRQTDLLSRYKKSFDDSFNQRDKDVLDSLNKLNWDDGEVGYAQSTKDAATEYRNAREILDDTDDQVLDQLKESLGTKKTDPNNPNSAFIVGKLAERLEAIDSSGTDPLLDPIKEVDRVFDSLETNFKVLLQHTTENMQDPNAKNFDVQSKNLVANIFAPSVAIEANKDAMMQAYRDTANAALTGAGGYDEKTAEHVATLTPGSPELAAYQTDRATRRTAIVASQTAIGNHLLASQDGIYKELLDVSTVAEVEAKFKSKEPRFNQVLKIASENLINEADTSKFADLTQNAKNSVNVMFGIPVTVRPTTVFGAAASGTTAPISTYSPIALTGTLEEQFGIKLLNLNGQVDEKLLSATDAEKPLYQAAKDALARIQTNHDETTAKVNLRLSTHTGDATKQAEIQGEFDGALRENLIILEGFMDVKAEEIYKYQDGGTFTDRTSIPEAIEFRNEALLQSFNPNSGNNISAVGDYALNGDLDLHGHFVAGGDALGRTIGLNDDGLGALNHGTSFVAGIGDKIWDGGAYVVNAATDKSAPGGNNPMWGVLLAAGGAGAGALALSSFLHRFTGKNELLGTVADVAIVLPLAAVAFVAIMNWRSQGTGKHTPNGLKVTTSPLNQNHGADATPTRVAANDHDMTDAQMEQALNDFMDNTDLLDEALKRNEQQSGQPLDRGQLKEMIAGNPDATKIIFKDMSEFLGSEARIQDVHLTQTTSPSNSNYIPTNLLDQNIAQASLSAAPEMRGIS